MDWNQTKSRIIAECRAWVEPFGYRLVKSRDAFEKSSATERRGVYILLIASKHGNYTLRVWCGIRNNAIEERFHKTSGVDKKHRANYTTLNLDCGHRWYLNSEEGICQAVAEAKRFIVGAALPFLEREYAYQDYCVLLNSDPRERCPYHGNRENRCHYGLIAAKFAGDARYEDLKNVYSEFLQTTNNGFYYPRFKKLIADLES
jgi:hypothetical protein